MERKRQSRDHSELGASMSMIGGAGVGNAWSGSLFTVVTKTCAEDYTVFNQMTLVRHAFAHDGNMPTRRIVRL